MSDFDERFKPYSRRYRIDPQPDESTDGWIPRAYVWEGKTVHVIPDPLKAPQIEKCKTEELARDVSIWVGLYWLEETAFDQT